MHKANLSDNKRLYALCALKKSGCSIVRSVLEYACPVWAALPKYLDDVVESVEKRAQRIVLSNCDYDDALIQPGITALSQRREEACINFIKRDCLLSPVLKPLIPCVSIDRPTASIQVNVFRCALSPRQSDSQISAPLSFKTSCNLVLVIFSMLCSAFNHIYIIIYLIVFVLYCLQPLGCERDINKLLLVLLLGNTILST